MAAPTETSPSATKPSLNSYQTALCVVPPVHICRDIDRLRSSHDKAYGSWPAHVNLVYPFVALESLSQAIELIRLKLNSLAGTDDDQGGFPIYFDSTDSFSHRHNSTVFLAPVGFGEGLKRFRSLLLEAFGRDAGAAPSSREEIYHPHLTIGQSTSEKDAEYLMSKASLLLPLDWQVRELVVLVRERPQHHSDASASQMKVWGVIGLSPNGFCEVKRSAEFCEKPRAEKESSDDLKIRRPTTQPELTYHFSESLGIWQPIQSSTLPGSNEQVPNSLTISSYNVLVDSTFPPAQDRYPLLVRTLLSEPALADVVVMQEVSDAFLSCLLQNHSVRSRWPFVTHGPPGEGGIGPLPSLRNIVVLSRWKFHWEWLPFERKHKGTAILVFEGIGISKRPTSISAAGPGGSRDGTNFLPLVMAAVHLTSGLTDGAVAAKKSQLSTLVSHLSRTYTDNPWIVAGDFNLTTSAVTIDAALRSKSISAETADTISSLETLLSEARLSDSWFVARIEGTDTFRSTISSTSLEDIHDGEEGATFNPMENALAAEMVGSGLNRRPQRYDRILVKGEDVIGVSGFGMFGFPEERGEESGGEAEGQEGQPRYGSDHWGIRATLRIEPELKAKQAASAGTQLASLEPTKAPKRLTDVSLLKSCLANYAMLPTEKEIDSRKEAFALLKSVLRQKPTQMASILDSANDVSPVNTKSSILLVIVPVGSYGLGIWNASSDIDCLCVGSISTKTFFALASQRLRKAADLDVRILRTVKAASGTMLELEIRGVRLDLQYCPATKIAER
jgi:2'-5' RNA ligase